MAEKQLKIELTGDQQKQIKDATGKSLTHLNLDLDSTGALSDKDLDKAAGGWTYITAYKTQ
jgi:hypothetical protein